MKKGIVSAFCIAHVFVNSLDNIVASVLPIQERLENLNV